jgi:hypothetical protein
MGGEGKRRERGSGGSRRGSCKGPKLVGSAVQGSNYSKAHTSAVAQAATEWEQLQQCRNSFVSLPPVQLGSPFFGTLDCVSLVSSFATTMSSSTFTFDDWDNVLSAPTIVGDSLLPTPSTSVLTSASSPSGEYQPFTTVGIAVSGGDGRKNVSLIFGGHVDALCAGMIGKSKFCIKTGDTTTPLRNGCVVQAHTSHKFSVDRTAFYVKESDSKAFIKPTFPGAGLDDVVVEAILQKTIKECELFFGDLEQRKIPDWLKPLWSIKTEHGFEGVEVLTSLRLTVTTDRLLHPVPTLLYEDESVASGETEIENAKLIKEYWRRFSSIKSKWSRAFCDMEANHLLVVKDLQVLQSSATSFASQLGTISPTENFTPGATIWSVLSGFAKTTAAHGAALVVASESTQDLRQLLTELAESHEAAQAQITSKLQLLERLSHVFESRFNKILPLILSLKGQPPTVSNKPGDDLRPVLYLKNLEIYFSRDLQNLQIVPPKLRQ